MSTGSHSDQLSSLFDSLSVLLSVSSTFTEHLQRTTVLTQLCRCWSAGHNIKLICSAESHEPLSISQHKPDADNSHAVMVTSAFTGAASSSLATQAAYCLSSDVNCDHTNPVLNKEQCSDALKHEVNEASADSGTRRERSSSDTRAEDSDTEKFSDSTSENTMPTDGEDCTEEAVQRMPKSKLSTNKKYQKHLLATEQARVLVKKRGRPRKLTGAANKATQQNDPGNIHKLPYQCTTCDRRFRNQPCLKLHILTHTGERPYACRHPGCDKRFAQPGTRVGHEQTHSSSPPRFICVLCGRTYRSNRALREHIRDLHTESTALVPQQCCAKCGRMFQTVKALKRHIRRTHSDNLRYSCDVCPKQFKTLTLLKRHQMALHSDVRPWKCAICDKTFSQAANMRTHMRVHTGEKPFVCAICGVQFAHSGTLKGHMITHRGNESKEV